MQRKAFKADALDLQEKNDQLIEQEKLQLLLDKLADIIGNLSKMGKFVRLQRYLSGTSVQYVFYFAPVPRKGKKNLVPHVMVLVKGTKVRFLSNVDYRKEVLFSLENSLEIVLENSGSASVLDAEKRSLISELENLPWDNQFAEM